MIEAMSLWKFFFGAGNQLHHEKNKAILAGPAEDIARIREFDKQVGDLTAAYNGVARVPDVVTKKIDALAEEIRPSLERVIAKKPYEESALERAAGWAQRKEAVTEVPVDRLEYVITYPASYGKPVEQRLGYFKIGK
jgi:hypothetical protein